MSKRTRSKQARKQRRHRAQRRRSEHDARFVQAEALALAFASEYLDENGAPLDSYERALKTLMPRGGVVPAIAKLSDNTPERMWAMDPWLHASMDSRGETDREVQEMRWEANLLEAESKKLVRWIPQPVPMDAVGQKRSILANTDYVCYLEDNRGWYIGREIWAGLYDVDGNRHGVRFEERWSGPYVSESVAQRTMVYWLEIGANRRDDPNSPLPVDKSDWRDAAKGRNSALKHLHVPEPGESEEQSLAIAATIRRRKPTRAIGFLPEDVRLASNLEHTRS